ncbi:MAG: hypothetical protein RL341_1232 [Pseudomonadota bacterium]|jgi:hypothetical protein
MRVITLAASALIATLLTGCATPRPPTAQEQMAAAVQEAFPADLLKGAVTDADVASLFAMFRAALKGEDPQMPSQLDKKLEQLSEELPARMMPLMDKLLTIAEKEVQKSLPAAPAKPQMPQAPQQ